MIWVCLINTQCAENASFRTCVAHLFRPIEHRYSKKKIPFKNCIYIFGSIFLTFLALNHFRTPYHFPFFIFKKTNFQGVSVEDDVGAMVEPFSQIQVSASPVFQLPVNGQMPMPKDKIIRFDPVFDLPIAILQEPFAVASKPGSFFRRSGGTTGFGGKIGDSNAPPSF